MMARVHKKEPSNVQKVRLGKITSKRQLTIPKDFFDMLNLGVDVEIILEDDELRIRKHPQIIESHDDYADLVLKSILDEQGFTTKEALLEEFRRRIDSLPSALERLLADVHEQVAEDHRTSAQLDKEIFGED